MIRINLLPWREELRKEKQKEFTNAFAVWVMFSAAIFAGIHFHFEEQQAYQTNRNKMLQDETTLLDKQIVDIKNIEETKKHLINKISVIHNLQRSRPEIVHLFNEIPHATPDSLFLTKLTRTGRDLTFEGKSQSNTLVSAFMSAIEGSPWLEMPMLEVIQSQDKLATEKTTSEKLHVFTLRAKQRNLPETK
jgi:type IV pilus assembly protein PilN